MNERQFAAWLKKYLRKISKYWPEKTVVYHRVKIDRGIYQCESCKGHFAQKELQIDHIYPVIEVTGFVDWNNFIERLFCSADKLQALCKPCHKAKSLLENQQRYKKKKKK